MDTAVLSQADIILRLGLGFLAGAVVGFERSSRHQAAGMRTHILIATGSTLLMLLSIWLPQEYSSLKGGDPGRIAAQVVSGIGFLGAGAMIRLGNNIKGLTTAASLWLIAAVGLAIGAGFYVGAAVVELITLFTLSVLDLLEKHLFPAERNKIIELQFKNSTPDIRKLHAALKGFGIRVQSMDVDQSLNKGKDGTRLKLLVGLPSKTDISRLGDALKEIKGLEKMELKEKY
jgi:putative Mg2+ transporter-C (MgtC) family protein